jgi:hypothetical protein
MLVYIDPITNQIEHTPFRKKLNHTERIPFASHHPKDVKKGTFLGEMSRLATLSSKRSHYLDAIRELGLLYIARGYPPDLVNSWIKNYLAIRWSNRLSEPHKGAESVFVLKSTFNRVWSRFNVQELGQLVKEKWITELLNERFDDPRSRYLGHVGHDLEKAGQLSLRGSVRTSSTSAPRDPVGSLEFPRDPVGSLGDADRLSPFTEVWKAPSATFPLPEAIMLFDVRKSDFIDRKFLVSRKRTRNLGDFVHTWNRVVLGTEARSDAELALHWASMEF